MKIVIPLFILFITIGCSSQNCVVVKFANTLYSTDLMQQGTKRLSKLKGNDTFYNMNTTKPLCHRGSYFFQSNGDFYQSDGSVEGTQKMEGVDDTMLNLVSYRGKLCYDKGGSSVYCLNLRGNRAEKSKLLTLKGGKRIAKIVPWVFGNRLLMLTENGELWVGGKEGESPSLVVPKLYQENISKILVTKRVVYFISNESEEINYFYNDKVIPKKVNLSYIRLPKIKYHADNIITDGEYLYFINKSGSIHKVDDKSIALRSTNSMLIKDFYRLIRVTKGNILYSTMKKQKMGCDKFRHHYELYKVNIATGQMEELAQKEQFSQTLGGCHHFQPPQKHP